MTFSGNIPAGTSGTQAWILPAPLPSDAELRNVEEAAFGPQASQVQGDVLDPESELGKLLHGGDSIGSDDETGDAGDAKLRKAEEAASGTQGWQAQGGVLDPQSELGKLLHAGDPIGADNATDNATDNGDGDGDGDGDGEQV